MMKAETKKEFRCMFKYGQSEMLCSRHRTLKAAKRAAVLCEKRGGAKHWFLEVRKIKPGKGRKRR